MSRRWSIPLWLEIATAVLIGLAISNAGTIYFVRLALQSNAHTHFETVLARDAAAVFASLLAEPTEGRGVMMAALKASGQRITLDQEPDVTRGRTREPELEALLQSMNPSLRDRDVRVAFTRPRGFGPPTPFTVIHVTISVAVDDQIWFNGRFPVPGPSHPFYPFLGSAIVSVLSLAGISFWMARRVIRPLDKLEQAAVSLSRGQPPRPVEERGPGAVRAAIRAFNAMSHSLMSMLESQRVVMAAVAHDLRSPITSLRLRAEFIGDAETRDRILQTLAEMQTMTEAVIDLARAGQSSEAFRPVDLSALAQSLVDDLAETGVAVRFLGGVSAPLAVRVSEVTRALRNLIENAVRYGGGADVSIGMEPGRVVVHVDDEGPGIPDDRLEAVFMPFARLEGSRSMETGGHGLGLTIARMIARGHGGDVVLVNRTPKGLRATLILPTGSPIAQPSAGPT